MNTRAQQMISLAVVLALHAAVLFGLGRTPWTTPPAEPSPLFVNLIAPPAVQPAPASEPPARSQPTLKRQTPTRPVPAPASIVSPGPQPAVAPTVMAAPTPTLVPAPAVVAEAPEPAATRPSSASNAVAAAATSAVITPPAPAAWPQAAATATATTAQSAGAGSPVASATGERTLSTDLAVTCSDRPPADYPMLSRRLNESGTVVLRVEIDERGTVATASVERSSGFMRLDAAALAAVRTWHCRAPTHNSQPVRATALQPFHFRLED